MNNIFLSILFSFTLNAWAYDSNDISYSKTIVKGANGCQFQYTIKDTKNGERKLTVDVQGATSCGRESGGDVFSATHQIGSSFGCEAGGCLREEYKKVYPELQKNAQAVRAKFGAPPIPAGPLPWELSRGLDPNKGSYSYQKGQIFHWVDSYSFSISPQALTVMGQTFPLQKGDNHFRITSAGKVEKLQP
jgi:hypothetical protein